MNVAEAKLILQTGRPGDEAAADPRFAEAMALVDQDPALAAWYAAEQRWDAALGQALQSVPVPPDLSAIILERTAGQKVVALPQPQSLSNPWLAWFSWRSSLSLAMAAAIALFLGFTFAWLHPKPAGQWAEYARDMIVTTPPHEHHVDLKTSDLNQIRIWLASHNGASGLELPTVIGTSPGLTGCRVTDWHGRSVSMLCFHMPGAQHVDFFVTRTGNLSDAPVQLEYSLMEHQMTAGWSTGGNTYLLTGPVPETFLRHCLEPQVTVERAWAHLVTAPAPRLELPTTSHDYEPL